MKNLIAILLWASIHVATAAVLPGNNITVRDDGVVKGAVRDLDFIDSTVTVTGGRAIITPPGSGGGISAATATGIVNAATSGKLDSANRVVLVAPVNWSAVAGTNAARWTRLVLSNSVFTVNTNTVLNASNSLEFLDGAMLSLSNTVIFNPRGPIIAAPAQHIFSGAGSVSFSNNAAQRELYWDWWGAKGNNGLFGITAPDSSAAISNCIQAAKSFQAELDVTDGGLPSALDAFVSAHQPWGGRTVKGAGGVYVATNEIQIQNVWSLRIDGNGSVIIPAHSSLATRGVFTFQDCFAPHVRDLWIKCDNSLPVRWAFKFQNVTNEPTTLPSSVYFENVNVWAHNGGAEMAFWIASTTGPANQEYYTFFKCRAANYSWSAWLIGESQAFGTRLIECEFNDDQHRAPFSVSVFHPIYEPNGNGSYSVIGGGGGYAYCVDFIAAQTSPTLLEGGNTEGSGKLFAGPKFFPVLTNQFSFVTNSFKGTNAHVFGYVLNWPAAVITGYTNVEYPPDKWIFEYLNSNGVTRITNAPGTIPYDGSTAGGTLMGVVQTGPVGLGITNFVDTRGSGDSVSGLGGAVTIRNWRFSTQYPWWDGKLIDCNWAGQFEVAQNRFRILGGKPQLMKIGLYTALTGAQGAALDFSGNSIMEVNTNDLATSTNMFNRLFFTAGDGSAETNNSGRAGIALYSTSRNKVQSEAGTVFSVKEARLSVGDETIIGAVTATTFVGDGSGLTGMTTNFANLNSTNGVTVATNVMRAGVSGVAFGKTSPTTWPVEVRANSGSDQMLFTSESGGARAYFGLDGVNGNQTFNLYNSLSQQKTKLSGAAVNYLGVIATDVFKLGINTNQPQSALHVIGHILVEDHAGNPGGGITAVNYTNSAATTNTIVRIGPGGVHTSVTIGANLALSAAGELSATGGSGTLTTNRAYISPFLAATSSSASANDYVLDALFAEKWINVSSPYGVTISNVVNGVPGSNIFASITISNGTGINGDIGVKPGWAGHNLMPWFPLPAFMKTQAVYRINFMVTGSGADDVYWWYQPTMPGPIVVTTLTADTFVIGDLVVTSNTVQVAATAYVGHNLNTQGKRLVLTNSMSANMVLSVTNISGTTNSSFHFTFEGAAAGGSDYFITNTVNSVGNTIPVLLRNGGVAAQVSPLVWKVPAGTVLECDIDFTFQRGTNFGNALTNLYTR